MKSQKNFVMRTSWQNCPSWVTYLEDLMNWIYSFKGKIKTFLRSQTRSSLSLRSLQCGPVFLDEENTDSFKNLHEFVDTTDYDATSLIPCIKQHISSLMGFFEKYFPDNREVWLGQRSFQCTNSYWFQLCRGGPVHWHDIWLHIETEVHITDTECSEGVEACGHFYSFCRIMTLWDWLFCCCCTKDQVQTFFSIGDQFIQLSVYSVRFCVLLWMPFCLLCDFIPWNHTISESQENYRVRQSLHHVVYFLS